jgi:arabinofuranosyltransferase
MKCQMPNARCQIECRRQNAECRRSHARYAFALGLLVALVGLSRTDLLLIAGPVALVAIIHSAFSIHSAFARASAFCILRSALWMSAGVLPLVGWTLFSVVYYGVPFPNTAYAKLGTGVPQEMLTGQGFRYLGESFDRDPLTLPIIAAAIVAPLIVALLRVIRRARGRGTGQPLSYAHTPTPASLHTRIPAYPAAAGVTASLCLLLYLAYIVRIGGDFMSGRFLAAPLVVAVFVLVRLPWPRRALPAAALVVAAAAAGLTAREPSVALLTGPSTQSFREMWLPHGVVDERSFYFDRTAFLTRDGLRTRVWDDDLRDLVADLRNQHPRTIVFQTVGMAGYYVGPDRHVIDTLALCDPLLARLPAIPPWRIGHYQRALPEGYFESVDTDSNQLTDPETAALYERIRLATRAPLWTRERWAAIWRLSAMRNAEFGVRN